MSSNEDKLSPEQRQQAEKLFQELDDLPQDSRQEALTHIDCDDAVRDVVHRRLSSSNITMLSDDQLLEDQMGMEQTVTNVRSPSQYTPIKKIGNYAIRRLIGAGGMGQVYEAVQEHPRRSVALKVMRSAIASEAGRRRFEYEVQILGRLRHPNIAQIYDADVWMDGGQESPYFVMEYVSGKPIDEHIKDANVDLKGRLILFLEVCDAVSHGHERGIIHRDLKPGNILVDANGTAKVIDFGVARATDSDLRSTEMQTAVGQLIGTLQYMSPEQCAADPNDIDIRSDVYALGVVLFELLSDRLPYDLGGGGIPEAVRVIRESAPTRLTTLNESIPRDIEVIIGKTLEKDRARRYRSAGELGDDIRRFLEDEAIMARPPSLTEHIRRYARKHRALASAVVFAALTLVLSVAAIIYFALETSKQRDIAERNAVTARAAETEAVLEAERANRNFASLRSVFGEFFGDLQLSVRNLEGGDVARELMVQMGRDHIEQLQLVAHGEEQVLLMPEIARSHEALGDILGGERTANMGLPEEALAEFKAAEDVWRELGRKSPDVNITVDLSRVLRKQSDLLRVSDPERSKALLDEARPMILRAIEEDPGHAPLLRQHYLALEALGNLLCEDEGNDADIARALVLFLEHRDLARQLASAFPDDLRYQRDLGLALRKIGWSRSHLGQWSESELALRKSLGHFESNARIDPKNIRHDRDIGWACWYLGDVLVLQEKHVEGSEVLVRCVSFLVRACSRQPRSADYRADVRDVFPVVHATLVDIGRMDRAKVMLNEVLLELQPVVEFEGDNLALMKLVDDIRNIGRPGG